MYIVHVHVYINTVPPFLLFSASSTSVSCLFTSCSTTAIHNEPTFSDN